eukprot:16265_6
MRLHNYKQTFTRKNVQSCNTYKSTYSKGKNRIICNAKSVCSSFFKHRLRCCRKIVIFVTGNHRFRHRFKKYAAMISPNPSKNIS